MNLLLIVSFLGTIFLRQRIGCNFKISGCSNVLCSSLLVVHYVGTPIKIHTIKRSFQPKINRCSFQLICYYSNFDFYVLCSNAHDESCVITSTTAFHSKLKSAQNSVIHTLVYSFELFHRHIIVSLLTMLASLTCFMIVIYKNLLFCCCPM